MLAARKRLTAVVMFWMLFQIAGIAMSLAPFAPNHLTEEICTCPDAVPGAVCPMHHQPTSKPDAARCKLQNACAPLDVALLSLAGGAGVISPTVTVLPPALSTVRVAISRPDSLSRAHAPDSPPPRA